METGRQGPSNTLTLDSLGQREIVEPECWPSFSDPALHGLAPALRHPRPATRADRLQHLAPRSRLRRLSGPAWAQCPRSARGWAPSRRLGRPRRPRLGWPLRRRLARRRLRPPLGRPQQRPRLEQRPHPRSAALAGSLRPPRQRSGRRPRPTRLARRPQPQALAQRRRQALARSRKQMRLARRQRHLPLVQVRFRGVDGPWGWVATGRGGGAARCMAIARCIAIARQLHCSLFAKAACQGSFAKAACQGSRVTPLPPPSLPVVALRLLPPLSRQPRPAGCSARPPPRPAPLAPPRSPRASARSAPPALAPWGRWPARARGPCPGPKPRTWTVPPASPPPTSCPCRRCPTSRYAPRVLCMCTCSPLACVHACMWACTQGGCGGSGVATWQVWYVSSATSKLLLPLAHAPPPRSFMP